MAPHISSTLRALSVNCDTSFLSRSTILLGADCAGTADSLYGTQNEQEITQNDVVEGNMR